MDMPERHSTGYFPDSSFKAETFKMVTEPDKCQSTERSLKMKISQFLMIRQVKSLDANNK